MEITEESTNMNNIDGRFASFSKRPARYSSSVSTQAHAGFFYTGPCDTSKCLVCQLEVRNWDSFSYNVDAFAVHKERSPNCALVASIEEQNRNIPQNGGTGTTRISSVYLPQAPAAVPLAQRQITRFENFAGQDIFISYRTNISYPDVRSAAARTGLSYKEEQNRLNSYEGVWPDSSPLRPAELAEAGLYFLGPDDRVQCAFCKGALHKWEASDNAYDEHKKHFPSCPFIRDRSTCGNIPLNHAHDVSMRCVTMREGTSSNEMVQVQQKIVTARAKRPELAMESARLATFTDFYKAVNQNQTKEALVEAGFFYGGLFWTLLYFSPCRYDSIPIACICILNVCFLYVFVRVQDTTITCIASFAGEEFKIGNLMTNLGWNMRVIILHVDICF